MNPHPESAFELPDRNVIDTYFRLFCMSFVRRIFPVVDPVLFKETIENAYQQPRTRLPYGKVSTKACVLAFAAFTSLVPPLEFEHEFRKLAPLNSETYFTRAQCLVPQVLQESASVEGLQVISMMVSPNPLIPLGLCAHRCRLRYSYTKTTYPKSLNILSHSLTSLIGTLRASNRQLTVSQLLRFNCSTYGFHIGWTHY